MEKLNAFLSDLKDVLAKYDATIGVNLNDDHVKSEFVVAFHDDINTDHIIQPYATFIDANDIIIVL